jgi:hypothetical protein
MENAFAAAVEKFGLSFVYLADIKKDNATQYSIRLSGLCVQ